jgi:NadR type nicotinamide-nucleotide adenylyltransferase
MSIKKIAVVGPESTGKSALSKKLAAHFNTVLVPEYAREYLERLGQEYQQKELLEIAKGQVEKEDKLSQKANRLLICDTNLVVIKIWSEIKYGNCDEWIIREMNTRNYEHHLLMNVDLPWEYDPYREHPYVRESLFKRYEDELINLGVDFTIIKGNYQERFEKAVEIVAAYL